MVPPALGIFDVISFDRPAARRWALILLATSALALSGCGRKGPLDLPPTASGQPQPQQSAAVQSDQSVPPQSSPPNLFSPNASNDQLPTTGRGPKRPFALDPLLNSN
jgi:predicted small lipoprotein YifL